ncbi:MAG: phosphoribosyltransferase family protein [Phycisphaerae bacterium]
MEQASESAAIGQVLLTGDEISSILHKLAGQISKTYVDSQKVIVIVLLSGAKIFAGNLFALINDDKFQIHYVTASSYKNGCKSCGVLELTGLDGISVKYKDVLIVDDIYDSGLTMRGIFNLLEPQNPCSIRTCILLVKQVERSDTIDIDFWGAAIDDCFAVGYGLDYNGQYRELPFIASLKVSAN